MMKARVAIISLYVPILSPSARSLAISDCNHQALLALSLRFLVAKTDDSSLSLVLQFGYHWLNGNCTYGVDASVLKLLKISHKQ